MIDRLAAWAKVLEEECDAHTPARIDQVRDEMLRYLGRSNTSASAGVNPFDGLDLKFWRREIETLFDQLIENAKNEPYAQILRANGFDPETHILVLPMAPGEQHKSHLAYVKFSSLVTAPCIVRRLW